MAEAYEYVDEAFVAKKEEKPAEEAKKEIQPQEETPVKMSASEQRARKDGWRPQEEWSGDPDKWVDINEFNYRGELMKRISSQSDVIHNLRDDTTQLKEALAELGKHNKDIAEREYKKAMSDLKKQRIEARKEDDVELEMEVEERMEELKEVKREADKSTEADSSDKEKGTTDSNEPKIPEPIQNWLDDEKNSWYNDDVGLRGAADGLAASYLQKNPDDFAGMLEYLDSEMPNRFPGYFFDSPDDQKAGKKRAAVSEPASRAVATKKTKAKKKSFSETDMSDDQRRIGRTFIQSGVFDNIQEYVDQLADLNELPAQQQ